MTIAVGDKAPDFALPASTGDTVRLSDLTASRGRTVVVFFYPKDDTPGCTVEACGFRDAYYQFTEAGAEVIGISSDSTESHARFASKHKLPMTLLSDTGGKVRELWGVRRTLGILPGRATFVVDRHGNVRHVFVSQLRVVSHVEQALEKVRQLEQEGG
jgi:peroxiredoxin Q/BCP